jgi:hypothetical protein
VFLEIVTALFLVTPRAVLFLVAPLLLKIQEVSLVPVAPFLVILRILGVLEILVLFLGVLKILGAYLAHRPPKTLDQYLALRLPPKAVSLAPQPPKVVEDQFSVTPRAALFLVTQLLPKIVDPLELRADQFLVRIPAQVFLVTPRALLCLVIRPPKTLDLYLALRLPPKAAYLATPPPKTLDHPFLVTARLRLLLFLVTVPRDHLLVQLLLFLPQVRKFLENLLTL